MGCASFAIAFLATLIFSIIKMQNRVPYGATQGIAKDSREEIVGYMSHFDYKEQMNTDDRAKWLSHWCDMETEENYQEDHQHEGAERHRANHDQPARPRQSSSPCAARQPQRGWPSESDGRIEDHCWNIPPRPPKQVLPGSVPPAINRDLKPGRRLIIALDERIKCMRLDDQTSRKPTVNNKLTEHKPKGQGFLRQMQPKPSPPEAQPTAIGPRLSPLEPNSAALRAPSPNKQPSWRDAHPGLQETNRAAKSSSGLTQDSPQFAQRHSLDLETQDLEIDKSKRGQTFPEVDVHSGRQEDDWLQIKDDMSVNRYVPQSRPMEVSDEQQWYVGKFSRVDAEHALHLVNREGAFLVRDCSKNSRKEPFVLAVFHHNRIFNIQIRFNTSSCKYALGTGIRTNDIFDSVADIIKFHSIFPIILIDCRGPTGVNRPKRTCILMYPIAKEDMTQLLS